MPYDHEKETGVVRQMFQHEDTLRDNRISWLTTIQQCLCAFDTDHDLDVALSPSYCQMKIEDARCKLKSVYPKIKM